ncbi:MAG: Rid family hydrolase [Myxococcota bacterium]
MNQRKYLTPEPYREAVKDFHLSFAVEDHGLVTGAVVGIRKEDGPAGVEAACRQAFDDLKATLAEANLAPDDLFQMTSYHVNILEYGEAFKKVRQEVFPNPPFPAWAAIGVESLWTPELLVEIVFMARKNGHRT